MHITKSATSLIPEAAKYSGNGLGLQFNCSYRFSKTTFLFINPTPSFINAAGSWKSNWSAEFNLNKIAKPNKLKINVGWSPNFSASTNTFKLGRTMYL
jgi:hypothetical protein